MKTNKDDIRALKSKHRLELVMQETGESFEVDAANSDLWRGTITHGLTVDTRRQMYEIKKPGTDTEAGDVLTWLQSRFNWSFAMAVTYLKKRPADPKRETQPAKVKNRKQKQFQQSDYATISNIYTNPETGAQSYGTSYNYDIMDKDQQKALDLWSDAVKYFDKSSDEVWDKIQNYPKRFKPVVDFDIEKCANCEKPFNWKTSGMIAYAQEEEKWISVTANNDDIEVNGIIQADGWEEIDKLFIDADFVICEECMNGIYAPRYAALELVYRSARKRKEALEKEQRQRDHEAWIEEEREREREQERTEQAWWEGAQARTAELPP